MGKPGLFTTSVLFLLASSVFFFANPAYVAAVILQDFESQWWTALMTAQVCGVAMSLFMTQGGNGRSGGYRVTVQLWFVSQLVSWLAWAAVLGTDSGLRDHFSVFMVCLATASGNWFATNMMSVILNRNFICAFGAWGDYVLSCSIFCLALGSWFFPSIFGLLERSSLSVLSFCYSMFGMNIFGLLLCSYLLPVNGETYVGGDTTKVSDLRYFNELREHKQRSQPSHWWMPPTIGDKSGLGFAFLFCFLQLLQVSSSQIVPLIFRSPEESKIDFWLIYYWQCPGFLWTCLSTHIAIKYAKKGDEAGKKWWWHDKLLVNSLGTLVGMLGLILLRNGHKWAVPLVAIPGGPFTWSSFTVISTVSECVVGEGDKKGTRSFYWVMTLFATVLMIYELPFSYLVLTPLMRHPEHISRFLWVLVILNVGLVVLLKKWEQWVGKSVEEALADMQCLSKNPLKVDQWTENTSCESQLERYGSSSPVNPDQWTANTSYESRYASSSNC